MIAIQIKHSRNMTNMQQEMNGGGILGFWVASVLKSQTILEYPPTPATSGGTCGWSELIFLTFIPHQLRA